MPIKPNKKRLRISLKREPAMEVLSYGFKPLADPEMRAKLTPNVTLGMACEMHGIDVQALIADLERLEGGGRQGAKVTPPAQRVLNTQRTKPAACGAEPQTGVEPAGRKSWPRSPKLGVEARLIGRYAHDRLP